MRPPIARTDAATAVALVLLAGAGAASVPQVRHLASAWWKNPETLAVADARDAIRWGDHVALKTEGSVLEWVAVRMVRPPEVPETSFRSQMAYRQAAMFVAFLQDTNPAAFATMMQAILDGRPFAEAVESAYHMNVEVLWLSFLRLPVQTTGVTK